MPNSFSTATDGDRNFRKCTEGTLAKFVSEMTTRLISNYRFMTSSQTYFLLRHVRELKHSQTPTHFLANVEGTVIMRAREVIEGCRRVTSLRWCDVAARFAVESGFVIKGKGLASLPFWARFERNPTLMRFSTSLPLASRCRWVVIALFYRNFPCSR